MMRQQPEFAIFSRRKNILGEGIVFLRNLGAVIWVDIEGRRLFSQKWDATEPLQWKLTERPTAIAPWKSETLVVATEKGLHAFDLNNGKIQEIIGLPFLESNIRLNDGTTDPNGRFWVGSMDEAEGKPFGKIYCLHPDGRMAVMHENVGIANGITFADEGQTMYYADSASAEIYRCTVDVDTGRLTNRTLFVPEGACPGTPDGATLDCEGYLWSCRWDGWGVARFAPDGSLERFIDLPVARPTKCTFGGPEMKTLYVSTARIDLSDSELADQPLAGSVLQISLPIAGTHPTPYAAPCGTQFNMDSSDL